MLVAAVAVCVGTVCFSYAARSLRTGQVVRRLRGRDHEGPSHPTDWVGPAGEDHMNSGQVPPERGSIERGVVLLALGACCLLFGVLAA